MSNQINGNQSLLERVKKMNQINQMKGDVVKIITLTDFINDDTLKENLLKIEAIEKDKRKTSISKKGI